MKRWAWGLVLCCVSLGAFAQVSISICGGWTGGIFVDAQCDEPVDILSQSEWSGVLNGQYNSVLITEPTTGVSIRVPLAPSLPWPTPPNWIPASGGSIEPSPPSTTPVGSEYAGGEAGGEYYSFGGGGCCYDPTVQGVIEKVVAAVGFCVGRTACGYTLTNVGATSYTIDYYSQGIPSYGPSTHAITPPGCPDGYVADGGVTTCNLVNASEVVKSPDGVCNLRATGAAWQQDANDPDCGDATDVLNLDVGDRVLAGDRLDGGTLEVARFADGTSGVQAVKNLETGLWYTTIYGSYPASGTGNVTIIGASGAALNAGAPIPPMGAGGGTGSGSGSGGGDVTVNTCGTPDTAPCKLDEAGVSGTDTSARGVADAKLGLYADATDAATAAQTSGDMSYFGLSKYEAGEVGAGDPVLGLSGSGSCVAPSVSWFGNEVVLSGVCTVADVGKPIIEWALTVFAGLYAWAAYSRRSGGA